MADRYQLRDEPIEINAGRRTVTLKVTNTGDRPVQVGSHFHFFEVNRELEFDRNKAYGMHLDIAASTAVRIEPGDTKEVTLTEYAGHRRVHGFNDLVNGGLEDCVDTRIRALDRAVTYGFRGARPEHGTHGEHGDHTEGDH